MGIQIQVDPSRLESSATRIEQQALAYQKHYNQLFQQVDALHHFYKGRFAKFVLAVFIVELLWTVDGYTHQPVVLFKEFAPFVGE